MYLRLKNKNSKFLKICVLIIIYFFNYDSTYMMINGVHSIFKNIILNMMHPMTYDHVYLYILSFFRVTNAISLKKFNAGTEVT